MAVLTVTGSPVLRTAAVPPLASARREPTLAFSAEIERIPPERKGCLQQQGHGQRPGGHERRGRDRSASIARLIFWDPLQTLIEGNTYTMCYSMEWPRFAVRHEWSCVEANNAGQSAASRSWDWRAAVGHQIPSGHDKWLWTAEGNNPRMTNGRVTKE
jgi:hypothetical protein